MVSAAEDEKRYVKNVGFEKTIHLCITCDINLAQNQTKYISINEALQGCPFLTTLQIESLKYF